jgi:Zn-dependent peptidase ImmA (M78 family)
MHQLTHEVQRAAAPEPSVLAMLRGLVPQRPLSPSETLRITELQANRLLEHFQIVTTAVPEEIISELPRIQVVRELGLPISGSAHWDGRFWVIAINADEHPLRQRFSIAHEAKHVIDHTTKEWLFRDRPFQTAHEQAERVADYFAACLLMPKRVVKRLWFEGPQSIVHVADKLQVSPAAVRYRLQQLGLIDGRVRCDRPTRASPLQGRQSGALYRRLPGMVLARGGSQ